MSIKKKSNDRLSPSALHVLKKKKEIKVLYKLCEMNSSEKGEGIFVLEVQIQGANLGNIRLNEILS